MYIYKLIFLYIFAVTTLVVVWIEITPFTMPVTPAYSHHSRSGVD